MESVVVEKIKEEEIRSRHAQLFMTEIIIELGHSHAPSRLPVKRFVTQKEKSKGICMEGYLEKYHLLLFLRIRNYPQPRRRSVCSYSVLFC